MAQPEEPSPSAEPALYSSVIIGTFVRFVESRYLHVNIGELLARAGMERYQVEDGAHWFTQGQVDLFYETLVKMTGNRQIAREAGRFTSSKEELGILKRYAMGMAGPAKVFEMIGDITRRYTRSARYESRRARANEFELVVTPHAGVKEKPYQCENRIGYFEAVVRMFNSRLPKIEHPECVFRGDPVCRYRVTWHESKAQVWQRARNAAFAATALGGTGLFFWAPGLAFLIGGGVLVVGSLVLSFLAERFQATELRSAIDHLRATTDELFDSVNLSYSHSLMINEIGRVIGRYNRIDDLLPQVIDVLGRRLDYDRGVILLVSADQRSLEYRTSYGYSPEAFQDFIRESFHLDKPTSRGIFVRCYREKRPFLVNDVTTITEDLSDRSRRFLKSIGSRSFLCCPILFDDECLGVLAVDNVQTKRPLVESDINLLMGIAPEIGISLHNALLTETQEAQFRSIFRVLGASIDAIDPLTAGHSERVTEFAVQICRQLNLGTEFTDLVRMAAQVHDYGKIAVDRAILRKEGPLTPHERRQMETHAMKTEEILSNVSFSGAYQQLPFIAGAHHERMDGTGYPRGLVGEQIPLGARIIAVADVFEALTAQRHYRGPLAFDVAVQILREASGAHLDPVIVQAFLGALGLQEVGRTPQAAITGV